MYFWIIGLASCPTFRKLASSSLCTILYRLLIHFWIVFSWSISSMFFLMPSTALLGCLNTKWVESSSLSLYSSPFKSPFNSKTICALSRYSWPARILFSSEFAVYCWCLSSYSIISTIVSEITEWDWSYLKGELQDPCLDSCIIYSVYPGKPANRKGIPNKRLFGGVMNQNASTIHLIFERKWRNHRLKANIRFYSWLSLEHKDFADVVDVECSSSNDMWTNLTARKMIETDMTNA